MKKSKKVCFIVGYYPNNKGGAEYQAYLLYQALQNKFSVFYISIGQEFEDIIYDDLNKIYRLRTPSSNKFYKLQDKINKILIEESPDIIYQRVASSVTGIVAKYCKKNKCKMVWHIANKPDVMRKRLRFNRRILINYVEKKYLEYGIKNTDYIIGQADYQNVLLKKNFNRRCDLIVSNFHPFPKGDLIKDDKKILILWVANFKYAKQPHLFIKLAECLLNYKNVELQMVGRNPEYIGNQKIPRNLKIIGKLEIDEVNKLLSKAHVFVNTSLYEGFPNTFIQAWMRAVPVISLNVDPDNVNTNNNIGFHSIEFSQLVKDVQKLVSDKVLRLDMAERAKKYAVSKYSLKNIIKIVNLIDTIDTSKIK